MTLPPEVPPQKPSEGSLFESQKGDSTAVSAAHSAGKGDEGPGWSSPLSRIRSALDLLVIAALCLLYLMSFDLTSEVNGPYELFQADGVYIIGGLGRQIRYPFNPQNHLLYHVLVDGGYALWSHAFGHSADSIYGFLKLFTALTGLAFLLSSRLLLRAMGLDAVGRAVLLGLIGVSVSAWFNFAAFETHALVLPPLALSLLALHWLASSQSPPPRTHLILIASLLACGLARTDGWRFTALVALLPLVPGFRRHTWPILRDVLVVGLLGVVLTLGLTKVYFSVPWDQTIASVTERRDNPAAAHMFGRLENLSAHNLSTMTRAAGVYAFAMPVRADNPDDVRQYQQRRAKDLGLEGRHIPYFATPLASMRGDLLALVMLVGLAGLLLFTLYECTRKLFYLDPFTVAVALQWGSAWLFFTWWNPFEPFLWTLEFLPLTMVLIAGALKAVRGWAWGLPAVVALLVLVHNTRFFYLTFC